MRRRILIVATLLGAWRLWPGTARAEQTGPELVVLPRGDTFQIDELTELAGNLARHLREAGKSLLVHPAQAFETLHSRTPRSLNPDRIRALTGELHASVQQARPERVAEIAYSIHAAASSAPEALIDDDAKSPSLRYSITQACFEGIRAHLQLNKLAAARRLIDWCASLTWLVERERLVRPDVRDILLASVREYDLDVTAETGVKTWLQGNEIPPGLRRIRTVPGAVLPIAVDCGEVTRVHNLEVPQGARKLVIRIDCAFNNAMRSDDRGLWLSSTSPDPERHALELVRILGTKQGLILSKRSNRYSIRAVGPGSPTREVSLPLVPDDGQLAIAVDQILQGDTSAPRQRPNEPRPRVVQPKRWLLWTGGSLIGVGAAGQVAGWLMYRNRSEQAATIYGEIQPDDSLHRAWSDARAPMLGVSIGSSALATAGVGFLGAPGLSEKIPWGLAIPSGAAGLALCAWGAIDLLRGDRCEEGDARECVLVEQRRDRGALLLAASAPFLALPVAKLARRDDHGRERVHLALGPSVITVRSRW